MAAPRENTKNIPNIVFQQAAGPHPGGHEEHVSGTERRDIENRYDCRGGAQV